MTGLLWAMLRWAPGYCARSRQ